MSPSYTDALLRIWHTDDPPGLRLAGQVDTTNQAAFMAEMLTMDGSLSHLTLDLREVSFLSFASLHALVIFAVLLDPGRRLVVHTKSPVIGQMLIACGWDQPELPLTLLEESPDD